MILQVQLVLYEVKVNIAQQEHPLKQIVQLELILQVLVQELKLIVIAVQEVITAQIWLKQMEPCTNDQLVIIVLSERAALMQTSVQWAIIVQLVLQKL